jgi:putative transposase
LRLRLFLAGEGLSGSRNGVAACCVIYFTVEEVPGMAKIGDDNNRRRGTAAGLDVDVPVRAAVPRNRGTAAGLDVDVPVRAAVPLPGPTNAAKHHRRSIRLKGYDYTQPGAYFVTIVTHGRECLFGEIVDGEMRLNGAGQIARQEWERLPRRFPHVQLDAFVIMPNHIHGIIVITDAGRGTAAGLDVDAPVGAAVPCTDGGTAAGFDGDVPVRAAVPLQRLEQFGKPVPGSIPTIVRSFKSAVTLRVNLLNRTSGADVWQRNYYEHVVRSDASLARIRQYIVDNPAQWDDDNENPNKVGR